jgi:NADPH-dependent 2,4-dienoyl-CoA reductase/sulfur reductase-like enzyme
MDPFVVGGGDATGLSVASKCQREVPEREVVVFECGRWMSYAHCGMPYYVKGEVARLEDLLSLSPAEVEDRGVDLRRGHEVVGIDTDREVVEVRITEAVDGPGSGEHDAGERFEQSYGDLLVATGASAREAFDRSLTGSFSMHDTDSAAAMRAFLADPETFDPGDVDGSYVDRDLMREYGRRYPPSSAAIVGGGYVGDETAEALAAHDLDVHLYQREEHLLPPFGPAVGERVETHLHEQGVTVHTDASVDARRRGPRRTGRVRRHPTLGEWPSSASASSPTSRSSRTRPSRWATPARSPSTSTARRASRGCTPRATAPRPSTPSPASRREFHWG